MIETNELDNQRPELEEAIARGEAKIWQMIRRDTRSLRAGETLVPAGQESNYVYRLRQGWAGRARTLPDGRTQYILIFIPGDLFAIKSMFVRQHPDAIETLSDAVVERVNQRELRAAYEADKDVSLRCTWQIVEEERRLHSWVVSLGRGDVPERLALLVLQLRYRLVASGALPRGGLSFDIPMTQQQLADHLGLSLVHLNKSLKKLREAGLIAVRGRNFTIVDLDGLVKLAAPLLDAFESASPAFLEG